MLNELLAKLEEKIQVLLDNAEILELENTELKEELESLKSGKTESETRLTSILDKLGCLDGNRDEPVVNGEN